MSLKARITSGLLSIRSRLDRPAPIWSELDLATVASEDRAIVERAAPYTITTAPRMLGLVDAVRYCVHREVPGALAECGVWRGGSVLAMIFTLQDVGVSDRNIYLYDTFEGMTAPGEHDTSKIDPPASQLWDEAHGRPWLQWFSEEVFSEEMVRRTVLSTGYPEERLHFVRGRVEETIPAQAPDRLALLRLDTDWYESTRHELLHLYPRLSDGGVLIIDDYGHWEGAKKAVDEYFSEHAKPVLLNRLDYAGRLVLKW